MIFQCENMRDRRKRMGKRAWNKMQTSNIEWGGKEIVEELGRNGMAHPKQKFKRRLTKGNKHSKGEKR